MDELEKDVLISALKDTNKTRGKILKTLCQDIMERDIKIIELERQIEEFLQDRA